MLLNPYRFAAPPAPACDPHWASVVRLLEFEQDGVGSIVHDASPLALSYSDAGSVSRSLDEKKVGSASLRLVPGGIVSSAISQAARLEGDYTVEFWYYPIATPSGLAAIMGWGASAYLRVTNTSLILVSGSSLSVPLPSVGVWSHVALTRQGNTTRFFINGNLVATATNISALSSTGFSIGSLAENTFAWANNNSYIDSLRITKGVCRYTDDFTPNTAPHPVGAC